MNLLLEDISQALRGRLIAGSQSRACGVSTDSRTVKKGNLFFALVGDTHDGHDHIHEVAKKGAAAAVVQKKVKAPKGFGLIYVPDTLHALGDLAASWRRRFPKTPVVAITGSNGKTTTKDLTAAVLGQKYEVLKTEGNFNNLIGVPLTLFRLETKHQIAVVEMGMNHLGEIDRLCEITAPQVAVITNIARAHLEGLGSLNNVAKAKAEILNHVTPKGLAILPRESSFYGSLQKKARKRGLSVVSFGAGGRYRARSQFLQGFEGLSFSAVLDGQKINFCMPVLGSHNITNALAALAVGSHFRVSVPQMRSALKNFRLSGKRMERDVLKISTKSSVDVINDGYNANPDSMLASLNFLKNLGAKRRRIAVLGEMLELGPTAAKLHREIGKCTALSGVEALFAVGPHADDMVSGARLGKLTHAWAFPDVQKTLPSLRSFLRKGDLMLVKGSRGMKMETVLKGLREAS